MKVDAVARLDGHIAVPGDKSISHRALLIGSLCETDVLVRQWGRSADTESTLGAVRALGVEVDEQDVDTLVVHGVGVRGLHPAERREGLAEKLLAVLQMVAAARSPAQP